MATKVISGLKYTKTHEWFKDNGDGTCLMGVTDHAQHAMGDVVFVELPEVGKKAVAGEALMVVESVKGANDVFSPVSGEVVEVNEALGDAPESVNNDAYGSWLAKIKMSSPKEVKALLDAKAYEELAHKEEEEAE